MRRYESGCVDCGQPCIGHACPNYEVLVLYCDNCGDEVDELWQVDGEELCLNCLLAELPSVRKD